MSDGNRDEKGRFLVGNDYGPGPGRNSDYDPSLCDWGRRLALLGLKDEQIAEAMGIGMTTYYRWQNQFPAFREAINAGKISADGEIAESLFNRAKGMTVVSEKAFKGKDGNVIVAQTKTQIPPDTAAAVKWLSLRQRKLWAEPDKTQDDPDQPNTIGQEVENMTDEELAAKIEQLEKQVKGQ